MFSKSFEKYVNSLKQKKYRIEHGCFIAEGEKIAVEILHGELNIDQIIALPSWIASHEKLLKKQKAALTVVNEMEMSRISALSQPAGVMLVVEIPRQEINEKTVAGNLHLVLENIQDPGNMGTIIRIADWFGIPYIFCSEDCVDAYNPKVIQATMGSIARIKIMETGLGELFRRFPAMPVYAAVMDGENIFKTSLDNHGFIIIGNEARGISTGLSPFIHKKITIPKFGNADSLNAAVAAGIVCAEFRKK